MSVKDLWHSYWQLTTKIIFARRTKVLFYYPQHFNRTAEGTNPFFDRMLETCEKHAICYQLIEEPDWGTDKPRNPKAIKGDALFVLITIIRKIVMKCGVVDDIPRERITAKIVNLLTFGRFRFPKYITISGSMLELFLYLNRKADVYDMQHGILFKQKTTFFNKQGHIHPFISAEPHWHWMMWGKGYDDCFCRGDEAVLTGRTHVVGYPIAPLYEYGKMFGGEYFLLSLQFKHDYTSRELELQKAKCEEALMQLVDKDVKVLFKHHPRFNNAININDWKERFPFCEQTNKSIAELLPDIMLHLTFNSTTSFEYAEYGIPSYFIDPNREAESQGDLFYSEYHYPLYKGMTLSEVVGRLQDDSLRKQDAEVVRKWYREFYDEFSEDKFIKVIDN